MKTIKEKFFLPTPNAVGRSVAVKTPTTFRIANKTSGFEYVFYGTALKKIMQQTPSGGFHRSSSTHQKNIYPRLAFPAMLAATALFLSTNLAGALGIFVPAYFYPAPGSAGSSYWAALAKAANKVPLIVIADIGSPGGPGNSIDMNYSNAIFNVRNNGGKVFGYVDTSYASISESVVTNQVATWHSFYNIDGIFLDQMTDDTNWTHLSYYETIYNDINALFPNLYLVSGNPGTQTQKPYIALPTVDMVCTFENYVGYTNYVTPSWVTNYPAKQFIQIPYGVTNASVMSNYVAIAQTRNVGWIYVNDRGWGSLPSYWTNEVNYVRKLNQIGPLHITNIGGKAVLTWNTVGSLQTSPSLSPPSWADILGANSPYTNPVTSSARFYRLAW